MIISEITINTAQAIMGQTSITEKRTTSKATTLTMSTHTLMILGDMRAMLGDMITCITREVIEEEEAPGELRGVEGGGVKGGLVEEGEGGETRTSLQR